MNFPDELKYTKEHEWIVFHGDNTATIGITDYAVEQLGDIVHVDLPAVGADFDAGDSFGTVESTKAVSDLYLPVAGKVVEINERLSEEPELIQADTYGKGWVLKVEVSGDGSEAELLSASEYADFIAEED